MTASPRSIDLLSSLLKSLSTSPLRRISRYLIYPFSSCIQPKKPIVSLREDGGTVDKHSATRSGLVDWIRRNIGMALLVSSGRFC
jgi:hypothetical protein